VELGRLFAMLADIPAGEHPAPQESQIHGQPEKWSDPQAATQTEEAGLITGSVSDGMARRR
jgi:hypothetical protein